MILESDCVQWTNKSQELVRRGDYFFTMKSKLFGSSIWNLLHVSIRHLEFSDASVIYSVTDWNVYLETQQDKDIFLTWLYRDITTLVAVAASSLFELVLWILTVSRALWACKISSYWVWVSVMVGDVSSCLWSVRSKADCE